MKNKIILAKNILLPIVLGGIVGLIISSFINSSTLEKPPLYLPDFLFSVVWSILYLIMGIAYGILVYKGENDKEIDKIYYTQLIVNLIWPIIYFVFELRFISIIWILILLVLIIYMIKLFYGKNKIVSYSQIPYLLWIIFAIYLNIGTFLLNI